MKFIKINKDIVFYSNMLFYLIWSAIVIIFKLPIELATAYLIGSMCILILSTKITKINNWYLKPVNFRKDK